MLYILSSSPPKTQDGIFGVLYTLSKEKPISSFRTAVLKLLLDFAQLVVFYVDPAFGWKFSAEKVYVVLYNFQLQNPLRSFGFTVREPAGGGREGNRHFVWPFSDPRSIFRERGCGNVYTCIQRCTRAYIPPPPAGAP